MMNFRTRWANATRLEALAHLKTIEQERRSILDQFPELRFAPRLRHGRSGVNVRRYQIRRRLNT
jgi:hypothetical protein